MKTSVKTIAGTAIAVAAALSSPTTAAPPPLAAPVTLSFEKCLVDPDTGMFVGTVSGECGPGSIVYEAIGFDGSKAVWELEGLYTVSTADCSFTAHCSGIANTNNGVIVLNGEVTSDSADFAGAQVQVRAELILGENSLCSEGTLTVSPR